eukprot:scaffold10498_cov179-Ochromonas_danica.AAC.7
MDSSAPQYDPPAVNKSIIPKRWEMAFLLFTGITIVYALRVNISVAAQDMRDELDWSESQKGLVLSAFYWGYAAGQIPSARLVQTYGAKWFFGFSVLIPSFLTLFVPAACKNSYGLALFIRAFIGMYMGEMIGFSLSGSLASADIVIEGVNYGKWPCVFYFFGVLGLLWFPFWAIYAYEYPHDHPTISREELKLIQEGKHHHHTLAHKGGLEDQKKPLLNYSDYGPASKGSETSQSNPIHGEKEVELGTEDCGMEKAPQLRVLSIGDHQVGVEFNPNDMHDQIYLQEERQQSINSAEEHGATLSTAETGGNENHHNIAHRVPWKAFFTNPHSLTLLVNSWGYGFVGFTLLSEMPSFFTDELGFDLTSAGVMCIFPYLALFIFTLAFGRIFHYLQVHHNYSTDTVRQVSEYIAFVGSVGGLLIAGYLNSNAYAAYVFVILSQGLYGAAQCGLGCAYSDVTPTYSSSLNSVGNMMAAIAGIVGPLVVSACLEEHPGIYGWREAFFITGAMGALALILWSRYQTSQIVPVLNTPCAKEDMLC